VAGEHVRARALGHGLVCVQRVDDIQRRLGVARVLQTVVRVFQTQRAHRIPESRIDLALDGRVFAHLVEQPLPHAFLLRTLAGKDESEHWNLRAMT
jgi:hypothetical protein